MGWWKYTRTISRKLTKGELNCLVRTAEIFATWHHAGQTRKDNVTPYIVHPAEVVASLKAIGMDDPVVLAAAWLHDTVEDTDLALDTIYAQFGDDVGDLVDIVTRRGESDEDRAGYHRRVLSSCPEAKLLKLADLEHNFRSIECLDEEAQARKLKEAREYYLPLKDELCALYPCEKLFDSLDRQMDAYLAQEGEGSALEEKATKKTEKKRKSAAKRAEAEEQRTYVVIRKGWIESERGWGQKPYGYSLHLTEEDMKAFIEEHWSTWPDEAPEWYYGPDIMSSPRPFEVDEKTYQDIKRSRNGIRKDE